MEMAFIAPFEMLDQQRNQKFQLLLPQHFDVAPYLLMVDKVCRAHPQHYVILDNGANEGCMATTRQLMDLASRFSFDEIVMPDMLWKPRETYLLSKQFMRTWIENAMESRSHAAFGYVLQGSSIDEVMEAIDIARSDKNFWRRIKTLYIPRHLIADTRDSKIRMKLALHLADMGLKKDIHLLGADPGTPQEIKNIGKSDILSIVIRSMDTSLPYVTAFDNAYVDDEKVRIHRRKDNYFTTGVGHAARTRANYNCGVLNGWAAGRTAKASAR